MGRTRRGTKREGMLVICGGGIGHGALMAVEDGVSRVGGYLGFVNYRLNMGYSRTNPSDFLACCLSIFPTRMAHLVHEAWRFACILLRQIVVGYRSFERSDRAGLMRRGKTNFHLLHQWFQACKRSRSSETQEMTRAGGVLQEL